MLFRQGRHPATRCPCPATAGSGAATPRRWLCGAGSVYSQLGAPDPTVARNTASEEHAEARWFIVAELPELEALDAYRPFVVAATPAEWFLARSLPSARLARSPTHKSTWASAAHRSRPANCAALPLASPADGLSFSWPAPRRSTPKSALLPRRVRVPTTTSERTELPMTLLCWPLRGRVRDGAARTRR